MDEQPPPLSGSAKPPPLWRTTLQEQEIGERLDGGLGIGGWLILVAIQRVLALFFLGYAALKDVAIFLQPNVWSALTTPGSRAYHPLWASVLIYDFAGYTLFLLANLVLIWLLFARKRAFPAVMIAYLVGFAVFVWGTYLLGMSIPAIAGKHAEVLLQAALTATLTSVIWVPYCLISVRVKDTFVR